MDVTIRYKSTATGLFAKCENGVNTYDRAHTSHDHLMPHLAPSLRTAALTIAELV